MRCRILPIAGAVCLAACADNPAAPPNTTPFDLPLARQNAGVAALGTLTRRTESGLVLTQRGFVLDAAADPSIRPPRYEPSVGRVGEELIVAIDPSTQIYLQGERASSLDAVAAGGVLIVAGSPREGRVAATLISDLASIASLMKTAAAPTARRQSQTAAGSLELPIQPAQASLCIGQNMDYTAPEIHEFHGCFGGPTASDTVPIPDIPLGCGLIGCWIADALTYTAALAGYVFDFPFRFGASTPNLVYHVPSPMTFELAALPASGPAFTMSGGLAIEAGIHFKLCNIFGCFDAGMQHFGLISALNQTRSAGPMREDQTVEVSAPACFSVGVLVIPNVPIDPLSVGVCYDLRLSGQPFQAFVRADGASGLIGGTEGQDIEFEGQAVTRSIRPDSTFVVVNYRNFQWEPRMLGGLYFTLNILDNEVGRTGTIPLPTSAFAPVHTPYPSVPGHTLATNPQALSEFLYQDTLAHVATFEVQPAPTTLTIISPPVLEQGMPMRARLTESFDGSRIVGAEIRFTATSASGAVLVAFDTTDAGGVAETVLPNGEHDVLVEYAGSNVYLPSSATQHVFVYLPTTFVIWGGNAGGLTLGARYQFWGAQWHKQVTGGSYTANASFKGWAHTENGESWLAGPGNSRRPPDGLGELIGVIVSTAIAKDGNVISGNVVGHVVLAVEDLRSYKPNPGHSAFGIMKAEVPGLIPEAALSTAARAARVRGTGRATPEPRE